MCRNRNCQICRNFTASISIAVAGNNLVINIPTQVLINKQKLCLLLAQTIPTGSGTLPVVITDGTTTLAMLRPCGNYVRADQLRTRTILNLTVATTPPSAIVRNTCALACTSFVQPQITGAAIAAAAVTSEE